MFVLWYEKSFYLERRQITTEGKLLENLGEKSTKGKKYAHLNAAPQTSVYVLFTIYVNTQNKEKEKKNTKR